ncbi:MAG: GNAT family N-acetyltransferase [Eubacteriales bacterium]
MKNIADKISYKIEETDDYYELKYFYYANELEIDLEDLELPPIVKNWRAIRLDGELIGGITLGFREGEYIIDGIAVDKRYRKAKLGKELLSVAISEIEARGGKSLYLVARAPNFFAKQGFKTVERNDSPEFFECYGCPQYNFTCFPEVMKLKI